MEELAPGNTGFLPEEDDEEDARVGEEGEVVDRVGVIVVNWVTTTTSSDEEEEDEEVVGMRGCLDNDILVVVSSSSSVVEVDKEIE